MDNRFQHPCVLRRHRATAFKLGLLAAGAVIFSLAATDSTSIAAPVHGWLSWRGPEQTGVSREKGLPDEVSATDALWTADFPGQSAAVIADGRVYAMGYLGQGPD